MTGVPGNSVRRIRALAMTQMSVQSPTTSMLSNSHFSRSLAMDTQPKVDFSYRFPGYCSREEWSFQPLVSFTQWGTGSFLPSKVSR